MGWDLSNEEVYTWTEVSPKDWKKELEKFAKNKRAKIKVKFINTNSNFNLYATIINPYGGVYPELDLKNFESMNKILSYVSEGGLFVNVADIPCYYAYNPLLKRRLDTTPQIYGVTTHNSSVSSASVRPFELTPLMEKLGLRVRNLENVISAPWGVEFEDKFKEIIADIKVSGIDVHRGVVCEKNIKPIIKCKEYMNYKVTPLFLAEYGNGKFLISLVFENIPTASNSKHPENRMMKETLADVIIKLVREK